MRRITGTTGFRGPITVLGASGSALHFIQDHTRQAVDSRIVDVIGHTGRRTRAIDFIMLTQIYGNTNPKHQWIDDIEVWDTLPELPSIHRVGF